PGLGTILRMNSEKASFMLAFCFLLIRPYIFDNGLHPCRPPCGPAEAVLVCSRQTLVRVWAPSFG
ncbi:hypothetical protein, partial [Rheinheimera sp.]|uniref:hypothetical protein n=1 Tax=Rheinheimera sp. TaxID=1869214 RepID=UPI00307F9B1A